MKKNYTEEEKSEIIKEIELNLQMEIEEIEEKFLGEANEYFRNSLIKNAKIHAKIKIAYVVQTKEEFQKTLGDSLLEPPDWAKTTGGFKIFQVQVSEVN